MNLRPASSTENSLLVGLELHGRAARGMPARIVPTDIIEYLDELELLRRGSFFRIPGRIRSLDLRDPIREVRSILPLEGGVSHHSAQQALNLGGFEAICPATEVSLLGFLEREVLNSGKACCFHHGHHFVRTEVRKGNARLSHSVPEIRGLGVGFEVSKDEL